MAGEASSAEITPAELERQDQAQGEGRAAPEKDTPRESDVEASPSEASKGDDKETLLEAVLKAVDKDTLEPSLREPTEGTPASKAQTPDGAGDKGDAEFDLSQDPTDAEMATYKGRAEKRIRTLVQERNALRNEAQVTSTLRDFLVANDIAREDFQLTLDLAAAMRRGDFTAFLQGVAPYVNLATQALGITLPPDLSQQVQAGHMTQDIAAQMSRDRYARALAEQHAVRTSQIATTQQDQQFRQGLSQNIEASVNAWESGVRAQDPDYARKEATVRNLIWSVVREWGAPQTPEQAVQVAHEAYNRANETMRQLAPAPRATRPVPSSINRGASGQRAEPKTMLEAAMLGLERARSA